MKERERNKRRIKTGINFFYCQMADQDRVTVKHIKTAQKCQRLCECFIKISAWEEQKDAQREARNQTVY